jgi:putative transposase
MSPPREGEAPAEPGSLPSRKHPAHGVDFDSDKPTIVFVTVCTKDRQPWLASPGVHNLLREVWIRADAWHVGQYVIMPNHVHLFASPNLRREGEAPAEPPSLEAWIRYWKSQFSKRHGDRSHRWQPDHWDGRLRTSESYRDKWEYVRWNPVRHDLVSDADAWPHQGKIHDLVW